LVKKPTTKHPERYAKWRVKIYEKTEPFPKPGWCEPAVRRERLWKKRAKTHFSSKFKVAFPKAEVLGKPQ
jgi:hypothetical protein